MFLGTPDFLAQLKACLEAATPDGQPSHVRIGDQVHGRPGVGYAVARPRAEAPSRVAEHVLQVPGAS